MKETSLITFLSLFTIATSVTLAQEDRTLWTVAWSANDKYLAIGGSQGKLELFDGKTFEHLRTYPVGNVILSRLKWHPNENKLAVITQSTSFKAKILDLDLDRWIELEGLESSLRGIDWNYTGELLAVSEFEGEISIFKANGKKVSRFLADPKSVTGIDWHPSENILAAVGSQIGIYNHKGDAIQIFNPRDVEVLLLCVEWHPSGNYFATGDYGESENADNKLIQLWNIQAEKLGETEGKSVEYRNIRWSPDGNRLASASDALRIWDRQGRLIHQSKVSDDYFWGIDWNSDGSKIITTSANGVMSIWDNEANHLRQIEY